MEIIIVIGMMVIIIELKVINREIMMRIIEVVSFLIRLIISIFVKSS